MDIYLIRHGETDWNKEKKLQGITDIPLNAYGIELAEKTAEGLKDVPFDRIYTSPLIRAKKTAEIIRGNRPIELEVREELKEISFGVLLDAFVIAALGAAIGYFLGKKLEQNDKAQKTFFENTSHELKTPLMAICGYAEEIEMGVITDYSQAGRMIVSQTERMSKLIEDILYLSKMESGTEPLKCEPIEMASLVQDILMPLEGIVNRRNLSVSLELDEGYVNGDPEKLEHAVANLITNSVKYACSQIEISWKNQVLSIWNDGGELSTEDFSHMFERFHTGQNGNSGIGLALSKEIVEMHGWKLSAKNDRHGICLSMVCHS